MGRTPVVEIIKAYPPSPLLKFSCGVTMRTKSQASVLRIAGTCAMVLWSVLIAHSQTRIENAVKNLSADNAQGYFQPFVDRFGADMNAGLYHSAEISDFAFHIQLQIVAAGSLVADADKIYEGTPPTGISPVLTATVLGDQGAGVAGLTRGEYKFPDGELKTPVVPFAAPQLVIGNVFGTQAIIRYLSVNRTGDIPKTDLFGLGLRHSINRYATGLPLDIAAGFFYQRLRIGDIFEAKAFNVGGQISKSWFIFTAYGGVQYESSTLTLTYHPDGTDPGADVSVDIAGKNHFSARGGLSIDLVILHFYGDISAGQVSAASVGVGLGN